MSIRNVLAGVAVRDLQAAIPWYARLLGREADSQPMPVGRRPELGSPARGSTTVTHSLHEQRQAGSQQRLWFWSDLTRSELGQHRDDFALAKAHLAQGE